jgi:hypothetical protein
MGKKPRSQRRKKGKSLEGNGNNGASSGHDDNDADDLDDDDRRADLLSESFTIADTGSVYSTSIFDDDFTAGKPLPSLGALCVRSNAS